MKTITLKYLQTTRGKKFFSENGNKPCWIHTDNGIWGQNGCGYPCKREDYGVYTLQGAYDATSHCGPEKKVRFHLIDESVYAERLDELLARIVKIQNCKEAVKKMKSI